jgi:hypothetical protein
MLACEYAILLVNRIARRDHRLFVSDDDMPGFIRFSGEMKDGGLFRQVETEASTCMLRVYLTVID